MAKLGEVCKVSPSTKNIERQGAWLLNLDMVEQQTGRVIEYKYVGEDDLNGSIIQFDTENVLYSKLRPNLNKVVLPPKDGFSTSELLPLRPDASVLNKDYLAAFLRSDSFVTWAVSKTAGAKMPRLGTKDLMNAEIPVPSIEQQKKIAEKFKKLEQLISLRKQQLAKLDELVKARFVEMFGEPAANPNRYKKKKLSEIAVYFNGLTYKPENVSDEGMIVLRSSNIQNGKLDFEDVVRVDCAVKEKFVVKENDILMCSRNGSSRLVGKVALIKNVWEPMSFGAFMMIIRSDYYWYLMTYFQMASFREQIKAGTTTTINQITGRMLDSIMIPLPPVDVQNQFATFAERVDQQKQTVQQSLEKLELLKKALMQEYFG